LQDGNTFEVVGFILEFLAVLVRVGGELDGEIVEETEELVVNTVVGRFTTVVLGEDDGVVFLGWLID